MRPTVLLGVPYVPASIIHDRALQASKPYGVKKGNEGKRHWTRVCSSVAAHLSQQPLHKKRHERDKKRV